MYPQKMSINQREKCPFSFPRNICLHPGDISPSTSVLPRSLPLGNKKSYKIQFPT
jgi:hypothetical protein